MAKLAHRGCVVGIDISEQMIDFAYKKYSIQSNLSFLTMDASNIIFSEQFDVITFFYTSVPGA